MIASLTFTSCEDFLTEEVRGQQNLDTYFQSAEEAEAFITGCYQAITFGGWWNINTVWLLSEMCSDDGWMGNTSQSQSDYISLAHYQGTGQSNGAISNFWQYRYNCLMAENLYEMVYSRLLESYCKTPEERYRRLTTRYPKIEQEIPLCKIASFLNVTPETISHIRKKIVKNS